METRESRGSSEDAGMSFTPANRVTAVRAMRTLEPFPSETFPDGSQRTTDLLVEINNRLKDLEARLEPSPSIIIQGRAVIEEWDRLTRGR
jgi:hypothetical protein